MHLLRERRVKRGSSRPLVAQCVPQLDKRSPGAARSLPQQSRSPPADGLPFQIAGVQRRKEPRLPASTKAAGTTRRIYLGAQTWTDPSLPGGPGPEAKSPLT